MEELYHLLHYLDPVEYSDCATFLKNFENISEKDRVFTLHKLLGARMLRRTKQDVFKDMVGKTEQIVSVSLMPQQLALYKAILMKNYKQLNVMHGAANSSGRNVLMDLRKICNHPYLFAKQDLEAKMMDDGVHYHVPTAMKASGKLSIAVRMLKHLKFDGNRVLVFTQFLKVLDIMEDVCVYFKWDYRRLDGSTDLRDRQQYIDDYNHPKSKVFIFLISTKAGGLGINLATSDTVIFYDNDFNPHNDIQALARSHRIGQKKHVLIFRLVSKDSVEERLLDRQKTKMMLAHVVIEGGKRAQSGLDLKSNELEDILKFGAQKIFKSDAPTGDGRIDYSDEDIKNLLDREKAEKRYNENKAEREKNMTESDNILNNYMGEFKVATFKVRPKTAEELKY